MGFNSGFKGLSKTFVWHAEEIQTECAASQTAARPYLHERLERSKTRFYTFNSRELLHLEK